LSAFLAQMLRLPAHCLSLPNRPRLSPIVRTVRRIGTWEKYGIFTFLATKAQRHEMKTYHGFGVLVSLWLCHLWKSPQGKVRWLV
jgi:hypothetical protein